MKTTIVNARIVTPTKIIHGNIEISDGRIISVGLKDVPSSESYIYDAKGKYVLPGLIETHGHFREPGLEHKEDIIHGTQAALAGGFTSVFDMPNTKPPTTTVSRLHDQINRYKEKSYCDFAINFGSSVEDIDELEHVNLEDINGVKVFMAGHETTPTTVTRKEDQAKIWEIASRRGFPVLAHAEDQKRVNDQEDEMKKSGRTDMFAYSEARNEKVVEVATNTAVELAERYHTKLWILHASTAGEFNAILKARKAGLEIGGEVAGYQLFFNTADYDKFGPLIKVNPALRTPATNKLLWSLVREGFVDGLCSEHTPHTLDEKKGDIWKVASGMPGVQETVAAFLTGWVREFGKDSLEEGIQRLAVMASTNVAKFFGYPQKSGIIAGNDADLVIMDLETPWMVRKEDLFTKLQWSAYEGMELIGRPVATFLRGTLMYENGRIVGERQGEMLKKKAK